MSLHSEFDAKIKKRITQAELKKKRLRNYFVAVRVESYDKDPRPMPPDAGKPPQTVCTDNAQYVGTSSLGMLDLNDPIFASEAGQRLRGHYWRILEERRLKQCKSY